MLLSTWVEIISVCVLIVLVQKTEVLFKCVSMIICDLSGFECDFFLKELQEISAKSF